MAITITAILVLLYAIWALKRRGGAGGSTLPGRPAKKNCKWEKTGHSKGRFIEFQCKTCGASAMPHTGAPPIDCKRNLTNSP